MMPAGQTPHTVVLVCYDDLVETVQPGDRMEVTGIFRGTTMRPNKNQRAIKAVMKTYLDVVHYKRSGKGKLARVSTGSEADSRAESYVVRARGMDDPVLWSVSDIVPYVRHEQAGGGPAGR